LWTSSEFPFLLLLARREFISDLSSLFQLGGVLYERLGWHAPIIFSIVVAGFDLIGRLLILETATIELWADKETVVVKADRTFPPSTLSVWELMKALLGSPRGLTAYGMTFV